MRVWGKRLLIAAGVLVALVVVAAVTGVLVLRSDWFHEQVRQRIVAEVERATGGTVEIGGFRFDWSSMDAHIDRFVLHGTEAAGEEPLLAVNSIDVGLHVISLAKRDIDIALLRLDAPRFHIVYNDQGHSNFPGPGGPPQGDLLAPLLRFAVTRLEVRDGWVQYEAQRFPLSITGDEVRLDADYQDATASAGPAYSGNLSAASLVVDDGRPWPPGVSVDADWVAEANRVRISSAHLETANSTIELEGAIEPLRNPVWTGRANADLAVAEFVEPLSLPIASQGRIHFTGDTVWSADERRAEGQASAEDLAYRSSKFRATGISGESQVVIDTTGATLRELTVNALGSTFTGAASLGADDSFSVNGAVRGLTLRGLAASAGVADLAWTGGVAGPVSIAGFLGANPVYKVDTNVTITPRPGDHPAEGAVQLHYDSAAGSLEFGPSQLASDSTRASFSGMLASGIDFTLETAHLDELLPVAALAGFNRNAFPASLSDGDAQIDGTLSGVLSEPRFAGHVIAGPLVWNDYPLDRIAGDVIADSSQLEVSNFLVQRGLTRLLGNGSIALTGWRPEDDSAITADFSIAGADIATWLEEFDRTEPIQGTLSGAASLNGSLADPHLLARVHAEPLAIDGEVFQNLDAEVRYSAGDLLVQSGRLDTGVGSVGFEGDYKFSGDDWYAGSLTVETIGSGQQLSQWNFARAVTGTLDANVGWKLDAGVDFQQGQPHLASLAGEVALEQLRLGDHQLGDVHINASNRRNVVVVDGTAQLHDSDITARAEWSLVGNSLGLGQISFRNLSLDVLRDLGLFGGHDIDSYIQASLDGEIGFTGPILDPANWVGMAQISRLEITSADVASRVGRNIELRNAGTLMFSIDRQEITVESGRLVANDTDLTPTGTLSFRRARPWDLQLQGDIALNILQLVKPDLLSEGIASLNLQVRGSLTQPQINGRLEFQNAAFFLQGLPNGLDQVNGAIVFDTSRATFERFTSRTGGGDLQLAGFVLFPEELGGELVYRLQAQAKGVRVRYPEGVSTVLDANLDFTGTSTRSMLSGDVTVTRAAFTTDTDIGSVLLQTSRATPTADLSNPFLRGMGFDIHVVTPGGAEVMTSLTRDIELEADLQVRGGPARPVVIGRINVNQGEITFFGNRYTISQGEIRFFNPARIEPVVSLDLETRVRSYTVMINLSGPLDKLNFSYRSDPPLQPDEIIALLAVGRTPDSVRTTGAGTTAGESFLESGGNSLLGQALSAPVSSRLQRFFGVSRIKIDPQLTGVENTPQTHITIEQQLSREITVTYVTNLSNTQEQVVRVEWNFSPDWSVYAVRDSNGIFGLDFVYRRRF